jgi:excisionase family DNA binding protein
MKYLTVNDVAERLQVSRDTVTQIVHDSESKFPAPYVFRRQERWLESEVEAWIESRKVVPNA